MSITVRLNDGVELHIGDRDYEKLAEAFQTALDDNKALEVHNSEGLRLLINPTQILYFAQSPGDPPKPAEEKPAEEDLVVRMASNGNGHHNAVGEPVAGPRA